MEDAIVGAIASAITNCQDRDTYQQPCAVVQEIDYLLKYVGTQ